MGVYNGEPIRPCTQRTDMTDITIRRLQSSVKNLTNKQTDKEKNLEKQSKHKNILSKKTEKLR